MKQITSHLKDCDSLFSPPLSSYVDIKEYSKKLKSNAICFEIWNLKLLLGLLGVYRINRKEAYITNLSVLADYQNQGLGHELLNRTSDYLRLKGTEKLILEVYNNNIRAKAFYEKNGFKPIKNNGSRFVLEKHIL